MPKHQNVYINKFTIQIFLEHFIIQDNCKTNFGKANLAILSTNGDEDIYLKQFNIYTKKEY